MYISYSRTAQAKRERNAMRALVVTPANAEAKSFAFHAVLVFAGVFTFACIAVFS